MIGAVARLNCHAAVWVGIGPVGVAVAGMMLFCEPVTSARVLFLSLIVVGIVGLRLAEA